MRLFSTNKSQSPEVPSVSVAGQTIPVSLPAILCPLYLYKVMKPVVAFLSEREVRLIIYLDDLLILCNCRNTLLNQLELIKGLFQTLGLLINKKKSHLRRMYFWVYQFHTLRCKCHYPRRKYFGSNRRPNNCIPRQWCQRKS